MKRKCIQFVAGLAILISTFLLLPALHSLIPGSKVLRKTAKEAEIDTNALFYSEESRSASSRKAIEEKLK